MTPEEKKQMIVIFNEGVEQVILPLLQNTYAVIQGMQTDIKSLQTDMQHVKSTLDDHTFRLDRMERKLDATVNLVDKHDVEIKQIKKAIG